jgi:hypothetical protein
MVNAKINNSEATMDEEFHLAKEQLIARRDRIPGPQCL